MQERYYSDREAPQIVPLSTAALRKRRLLGLPPKFLRLGRKIAYSESDLKEFLRDCEQHPRDRRL